MKYSYVDIRKLQNAAGVDFETADKALKKAKGNFSKAEYFARKRKEKAESRSGTTQLFFDMFAHFFSYRFIAYKGKTTCINLPLWIIILLAFFLNGFYDGVLGILLLPLIISLFMGVEYKIAGGPKKKEPTINTEPAVADTCEDESLNINLSEEVVEDDEEGFVKVEIDK